MPTTTTQVTDLVVVGPAPPDPDRSARAWTVAGLAIGDVLGGVVSALTSNNIGVVVALIALLPIGVALHLALTQVEKEIR